MNKFGEARLTSVTSIRCWYCSRTDTSRLNRIAINTALPHGKTDVIDMAVVTRSLTQISFYAQSNASQHHKGLTVSS